MKNLITVKTNTITSVNDVVAIRATQDLVDNIVNQLEALSALGSRCMGCPFTRNGSGTDCNAPLTSEFDHFCQCE
jgi:hypothetical protein